MTALIVGVVLAVGALAFVLYPLFFTVRPHDGASRRGAPEQEGDLAIVALREIEFDRATGKLSDVDYDALRKRYVGPALAELRRGDAPALASDPVDLAVRAYRATHKECPTCGSRPERGAVFCSDCGRYLDAKCRGCGEAVVVAGAAHCPNCGHRLAA
jgi:hypothetical protein